MVAVLWWSYKLVWNRDTQQGEKATERRKDRGRTGWRCGCLLWQVQTTGNTGNQQEQETPSREKRLQREGRTEKSRQKRPLFKRPAREKRGGKGRQAGQRTEGVKANLFE